MPRRAKIALETQALALPAMRSKPVAPADLTPEQATDWLKLAGRIPDDVPVEDIAPVLTELARHMSYSRQLAEELAKLRSSSLRSERTRAQLADLLNLHQRQSMRVAVLSAKLRLTPQVREQSWEFDRRRLRAPAPEFKPWEAGALVDLEAIEVEQPESMKKN
jgi:hypothetical protein